MKALYDKFSRAASDDDIEFARRYIVTPAGAWAAAYALAGSMDVVDIEPQLADDESVSPSDLEDTPFVPDFPDVQHLPDQVFGILERHDLVHAYMHSIPSDRLAVLAAGLYRVLD